MAEFTRQLLRSRVCASHIARSRRFFVTHAVPDYSKIAPTVAFSFDIDGVLLRGAQALEEGKAALKLLDQHKIPYILLTNGGGKPESARVAELSEKLGVEISEQQFVQSHTPYKRLVMSYQKVLVIGGPRSGNACRKVAQNYGFKDCVTAADIVAANPAVWPFHSFSGAELQDPTFVRPLSEAPFDAVLVFNDSRDWGTDIQIMMDVLTSKRGKLGTSTAPKREQTVPVYFSNNDLLWANEYSLPRFGQGAFRTAVEQVFEDFTGEKLSSTIIGKPFLFTFEYAHTVLKRWREHKYGYTHDLKHVYMVGDNPESDIRGGNGYGWMTLLVRTGVYRDGDKFDHSMSHVAPSTPSETLDDVLKAVKFGIDNEHKLQHLESS
ncbi:HAD-like domain-containing protein [Limtongia smithiae]|uniref:HAD-like domain-containing protein n=1 Tax=Limtongia smithiae TaxID=1125753 RepID=UPI0034CE9460